jgi:arylsulfatase A-like enzyme
MSTPDTDKATRHPNIIWFFADQMRAQSQSWMGDPNLSTPNLDRMACEGVAFTRAVSPCPWCTPFRGSLLTSLHTHQCVQRTPQQMDPSLPTVATCFDAAGYDTCYIGKWHLDGGNGIHHIPPERRGGFRRWWGYENKNAPWDNSFHGDLGDGEREQRVSDYETDHIVDTMIAQLENRAVDGNPFFMVGSTVRPHDPMVAPEEWMRRHRPADVHLRPNVPDIPRITERARRDLAGYHAAIEQLDWNLGRLRAALDRLGLADDTWLIFFSDHGDTHGSHGYWRKSNPFEESIRIPCIFGDHRPFSRSADNPRQAGLRDHCFTALDFAPTSLGLCGIDTPEWMCGSDYSGTISGDRPLDVPDSAFLQQCVDKSFDCLEGQWRGVVTGDGWKYVCNKAGPLFLFDLGEDPYETYNRAHQLDRPSIVQRALLHDRLQQWISDTADDFPLPTL